MIIPTHRLVAKYVYAMLDDLEKEKLHYRQFVWGNVKPDILPVYKRVSHYHPANEAYVFQLLTNAMAPNMSEKAYASDLGVLIHFLCDYTCIYHNNMTINGSNSMRKHMQYECLLHVYTQFKIRTYLPEIIEFSCIDDVKYHIYGVIKRANLEGIVPDMKADFAAMLVMSASVVKFLLKCRAK